MMFGESFSIRKTWATSLTGPSAGSVFVAVNVSKRMLFEVSFCAVSPVEISHPFPL
jgi:hypothetical protein